MNNAEAHLTNVNLNNNEHQHVIEIRPSTTSTTHTEELQSTTTCPTTTTSTTPLYDMFSKHIEQFIDLFQKKQHVPTSIAWSNLANMFSFQMALIAVILIVALVATRMPVWILVLGMIGIGCGFYSMVTKDPLGMFIYSLLNFIGLVVSVLYMDYGYAVVGMGFILLLLNQIKSIGFVIEFGRAKLGKRQVFETQENI